MKPLNQELEARLSALEARSLRRRLAPPQGLDLVSNDYLGLSRDADFADEIQRRVASSPALAAPASRLLGGHLEAHTELENHFARFKGAEAALFFSSGYQANLGLLTALLGPQDRALSDQLNHASLIDGLRLSGCRRVIVPHLDLGAYERALATPHDGSRTFLVIESLFSMDGDLAPLPELLELCRRYQATLVVDDAHATGVLGGERGAGALEHFGLEGEVEAVVSTCGKAMAAAGAFVTGSRVLIDYLVNRCRPLIFSTAASPLLVCAVEAALDRMEAEPERRKRVLALADHLRHRLAAAGLAVPAGIGPLVPVILGESERALRVAAALQAQGFDVRAVRPPTVLEGTARLRLCVHADHREADLDRLAAALFEVARS